jgi:hypothetical protein
MRALLCLTPPGPTAHPSLVLVFARRIAAAALVVLLSTGGLGLCGGWGSTPEARMTCCVEGTCPMHASEGPRAGATLGLTQFEADTCCLASERDDSPQSSSRFVPLVSLGPVDSSATVVAMTASALFEARRAQVPLPGSQVPKHLLFSVFLI